MLVPINKGSSPAVVSQVNNPRLINMYVDTDGLYRLPYLDVFSLIPDCLFVFSTAFEGGSRIVVTKSQALRLFNDGSTQLIGEVNVIGNNIRADENPDAQITITTGGGAYVIDQKKSTFTKLGKTQGFDILNPIGVVVLNTFTVIVGGADKKWIISSPNNALQYNTNDIRLTDAALGNLTGIQELKNNLFIFGENSSQRWIPSTERTSYDFPFSIDPSFRTAYGCVSPASLISTGENIYFLGNNNIVQSLSEQGLVEITDAGIGKKMSAEKDINFSSGAYFYYNNHYFYCLTFNNISWVYCEQTKKWSESTSLINSADEEIVTTISGVFTLSDVFKQNTFLELTTEVLYPQNISSYERTALNAVNLNITQGIESIPEPQYIDLSISRDNVNFSNDVRRRIAPTGKRECVNIWKMNLAANQFTIRFRYDGKLNLVFEKLDLLFN